MPLARRKKVPKVIATNSAYLDPLYCDSTISYKIIDGSRVWGSAQLADCSRKIEWYFNDKEPIEKIERAISMLEQFRDELNAALIERKRRRPRRKPAVKK